MLLPTVKITYRKNGAYGRINAADFDATVHQLFEEPGATKPVVPQEPHVQPAPPAPAPEPEPEPPTPELVKRGPGRPRKVLED